MIKKMAYAATLIAMSCQLQASPAPYVGGSIGIITNTTQNLFTNIINSQGFLISTPGNFRGLPFNAFLGYGGLVSQNCYLSGEIGGTVGTATLSNGQLKTSYGYGASLLPGLILSDFTMGYARLGVVRSRFSDQGQTVTGGQLGAGIQTNLTQNIDIRVEYVFTAYQSFNGSAGGYGHVDAPRSDACNLGLIYKFD